MAAVRKAEGYTLLFLEIFIIIMNTLAIIVILRFKKKYNPDILIFTLAVADLLKAFIPLNMTLVAYLGGTAMREGSASCIIFGWTAFTLNSGIMLVMTVMAIDRYVAICCPFRYKHYLSKKRLIYTIIAVFVFSGFHSMLPLIGVGQMRSYNNGSFCHFDFDSTIPASLGYNIFVLVFGISMLVVVIFCYTRAMFSIRGLIRRQRRMSTPSRDIDNADQKRQAMNRMFARLMIVMMMAFCVSWLLFLIVVLQHVSGWFEIPPEAHFWSMRLAVLNSVLNPIIGAAMCRPYRKGYMYILCKFLHCFGLCSSYNAEDPWTRSRKMSAGSRNSSDRDQNESPNTCETTKSPPSKKVPKSKKKSNPSFNSHYDSGIDPDSSDYLGTIGRHQAGVVNNAFELDTTPAGVTGHISDDGRFKARPGLNRKRISFKDEVEAKQMAGLLPKGDKVAEPVSTGVSDTSNTQRPATSFEPPTNQDEVNGAENGLLDALNENQPTSEAASCLGIGSSNEKRRRKYGYSSGVDQSFVEALNEPSSLGKPLEKNDSPPSTNSDHILKETDKTEAKTMYEVQTPLQNSASHQVFDNKQATADISPKALISNGIKSDQIAREISLMERSEQRQLTSPRDWYLGANQEKSTFETVQITHFPVDTSSDVKTSTLKSKSSPTFTRFSLRSSSFIERTQKKSLQEQKPRSRSFANDFSASEANSINVMVNFPENTTQARQDPRERQHSVHPTMPKRAYGTGALLGTQRFKTDGAPLSELLPNLSKTKSFESMLSNTRYKSDSTAHEGLYLSPFQRHSSSFKGGELKGTYKWSQSEPDLTRTLPATAFLVSPRTTGEQRLRNEGYKENVLDCYQRRASSPQVMPLSPSKIYRQLSELSQKDLEREVFC